MAYPYGGIRDISVLPARSVPPEILNPDIGCVDIHQETSAQRKLLRLLEIHSQSSPKFRLSLLNLAHSQAIGMCESMIDTFRLSV